MIPQMPADGYLPLTLVAACAIGAYVSGAMRGSGAWAGAAVGAVIAWGSGWPGIAMLATLLVVGTAVTARERRGRGALQVICNGGVAAGAGLAAGLGASWGQLALAGALAGALSDTVAGELGLRWGGRPRALLLGRALPAGADGGMTWTGTLAGAGGAFLVPLVGAATGAALPGCPLLGVAAAGFAGNLADSAIGLWLQPRLGRYGNDWTNLVSTGVAGAAAVALAT